MAQMTSIALMTVSVCLLACVGGQFLPQEACAACRALYVSEDCGNTPSPLCYLLALKLNFKVGDMALCNEFPCEGYGQPDTYECRGILGCLPVDINIDGVCPLDKPFCCRKSEAPSLEADSSSESELLE